MKVRLGTRKSFTLLELVVVLVVLSILAAIAIPTYSSVISSAKGAVASTALNSYAADTLAVGNINRDVVPTNTDFTTTIGEDHQGTTTWTIIPPADSTPGDPSGPSTAVGTVSLDTTTSLTPADGLAMASGDGGCAFTLITQGSVQSWYVSAAGMTSGPYVCSGTQALGGAASTGETGGGSGNTTTPTTSADAPVTPINCSWSVAGLSLPGSGDYIADVQNGQSPYFYDGVTDAAGGCTGLANNYNSVIAMVDQDGGVEVFSLADASYQAGSGTVDFSSDPSFDFHTIRTASSDADPGSILGAGIQWFSNAADAEASYSEVTPGYAFVSTGSGESGTVSLGADPSAPAATSGATPVSCSWSVSGLTSPTSSDIIAENDNNSSATYADGVTDVVGSCVGVSGTYAQLVDMQNADGGVEVLTVADSWYVTVGNAGISFSNDPTWDLNTFNPTTSGSGHRLDLVSVAWYDNAAGAEAATGNVPGFVPGTSYVTSSPSGDQAVVSDGS